MNELVSFPSIYLSSLNENKLSRMSVTSTLVVADNAFAFDQC